MLGGILLALIVAALALGAFQRSWADA